MSALARGLGHIVLAIQTEHVAVPIAQALAVAACLLRDRPSSLAFLMAVQAACALPLLVPVGGRVIRAARGGGAVPPELRREILVESAPAMATALAWRGLVEAPLWAAGLAIGTGAAALFGAAQRIASVVQLPAAAMVSILAPVTASLASRGRYSELEPRLRRGAALAAAGSALGVILIVAAGPRLPVLIYGSYFAAAAPVAAVLALAQLINSAAGFGGMTLQMMNQSRRLLVLSSVSLAALAVMAAPAAAALGVAGLAWAWLAAIVILNLLMVGAVRRLTRMRVYMVLG
jgi:O-antigen/teichoic acid export membrane protein